MSRIRVVPSSEFRTTYWSGLTRPRSHRTRNLSTAVVALIVFGALLALWQCIVLVFRVSPMVLPAPGAVLMAAIEDRWLILHHLRLTLVEVGVALILAFLAGFSIAFIITAFSGLRSVGLPLIAAAASAPKVVFAPTIIAALGLGLASKAATAALFAFFPICVNLTTGLMTTSTELLDTARMLRLSRWTAFCRIRLPAAMPHLVSGFRLAISAAFIGAVVAEFIASDGGAGYFIKLASGQLQADRAFAMALTVVAVSIGTQFLVARIARALPFESS